MTAAAFYSAELVKLLPALMENARHFCSNMDDAADLRSETVCRVLEHIDRYDPSKSGLHYFCCIVMERIFITGYNRRKVWSQVRKDVEMRTTNTPSSAENLHDYNVIRGHCSKTEVTLYADGYSYDEIADLNGIKLGTVKSRIANERKRLKSLLLYRSKNSTSGAPKQKIA